MNDHAGAISYFSAILMAVISRYRWLTLAEELGNSLGLAVAVGFARSIVIPMPKLDILEND